jgi:nitrous oxide reductase accessory protein NosL
MPIVPVRLVKTLAPFFVSACLAGCAKSDAPDTSPGKGGPLPAVLGIDETGRLRFSEEDRCPVCAMKVRDHPKFVCGIELRDGRTFYFCGTGCMIRSWLHPEYFLDAKKGDLVRCVVQDYFEGLHVDGMSVTWVAGSDVIGPMGPALVPLKDEKSLEAFRGRHGGRVTFRLADLDDSKWEAVTGRKALPQEP